MMMAARARPGDGHRRIATCVDCGVAGVEAAYRAMPETVEGRAAGLPISVGKVDGVNDGVRFDQEVFVRIGGRADVEGDSATGEIDHDKTDLFARP